MHSTKKMHLVNNILAGMSNEKYVDFNNSSA